MKRISTNVYTKLVGATGAEATPLISRMFTVDSVAEDLFPESFEGDPELCPAAFLIIPRGSGTLKVHMAGAPVGEYYTISSVEVEASIGYPLPYLVDTVLADAETTASISIGW